jgi:hypothetical protein
MRLLIASIFAAILIEAFLMTAPKVSAGAAAGPRLSKGIQPLGAALLRGAVEVFVGDISPAPAQILGKIYSKLADQGRDMKFGGTLARLLGLVQNDNNVTVRELPPLRGHTTGIVHIFFQLNDKRGYIVVRYSTEGLVAFRFGPDFGFIAAAERNFGQRAAVISGATAEKLLNDELLECTDLANGVSQ